jgi:hypothetical protein
VAGYRTLLAVMTVVTLAAAAYLLSRPEQRVGTSRGNGDISFAAEQFRA